MSSTRQWLVAVLLAATMVVVGLPAVRASNGAPPPAKLDPAFVQELEADAGRSYFDVLVVFEDREARAVLDAFGRPVRHYRHFPISRVLVNRDEITSLVDLPSVRFVELNTPSLAPLNEEGRQIVRADELQAPAVPAVEGLTGAGVHVAVIDSPIDGSHPALRDRIERNWVIGGTTPERIGSDGAASEGPVDERVYVSVTPDGIDVNESFVDAGGAHVPAGAAVVADTSGHGTHVAGTIASDGAHDDGVAPGARLHGYGMVTAGRQILLSYFVEAYDHLLSDPRIRLVNASVGFPGCDPDLAWLDRPNFVATRIAALDHGVLTVNSYGNFGASTSGANPKCASGTESVTLSLQPYVLGVGAVSKGRRLWAGSSRGFAAENHDRELAMRNLRRLLRASPEERLAWDFERDPIGLFRPGVVAPGVRIVSTQRPDHDAQLLSTMTDPDPFYGIRTGTSMAAPSATGVAALVVQAYRRHHGRDPSLLDLIRTLELSADRSVVFDGPAHEVGAGLVDAVAAVERTRTPAQPRRQPNLLPVDPGLTVTDGGVLRGTVPTPNVPVIAQSAVATASTQEVVVADGTWLLTAAVVEGSASAFEVFLYPPGSDRPVAQSADNYAPRLTMPGPAVAFPEPGTWRIRIERATTTPNVPYAVEWRTEAPAS